MLKSMLFALCLALGLLSAAVRADAPLQTALALDSAQAREITSIQAEVRKRFAPLRQEHNRLMRAARRAGLAHDEAEQTRLEAEAGALLAKMRSLRDDEEARIRKHLRADQFARYDAWLMEREAMHGSSRDAEMLRATR